MSKSNSKSGTQPVSEKNLDGYSAPLIPWSRVRERLEEGFYPGSGIGRTWPAHVLAGNSAS